LAVDHSDRLEEKMELQNLLHDMGLMNTLNFGEIEVLNQDPNPCQESCSGGCSGGCSGSCKPGNTA
jgi:hypothetical protein